MADVLHEQQLPEVLQELLRELAEVLAAFRWLFDQHERAGDVAVDDRVAEAEQEILLDGGAELEDVLDGSSSPSRRRAGRAARSRRGTSRSRRAR